MPIPSPDVGLVVRYDYLWRSEADSGRDHSKDRPACLVACIQETKHVVLLPVTHSEPGAGTTAVEIPAKVKEHLGLDEEHSWVIISECNVDIWPSPDLAQVPGKDAGTYAYGHIPPLLLRRIREAWVELYRSKKLAVVSRDK
jgi:hypothetical protein